MLNSAAMLGILEEAGTGVLTLAETLSEEEFFASRLTKEEVLRYLRTMAETAENLADAVKAQMPEIDWAGWSLLRGKLKDPVAPDREAAWFGVNSLVPATLLWLRLYKKNQPELFDYKPQP